MSLCDGLAVLFNAPAQLGYSALFGLILAESAGVPVPGETALLTAGAMAGAGHLALPLVIGTAATAAVIGDGIGYWIGRRGGRAFLLRDGRFAGHRRKLVARADRYFERFGAPTVLFGRFVPGVRVVAALMAGAARMPWRRFLVYNASGALLWATAVASAAALLGPAGAAALSLGGLGFAAAAALVAWWRRRRVACVAA